MKWIKYRVVQCNVDGSDVLINKKIEYNIANIELAKQEAYNGEYEVEEDTKVIESDSLFPLITQKELRSGILPAAEYQYQSTAAIISGGFVSCSTSLISSGSYTGITDDVNSAMAILSVTPGKTYTIFFPDVTQLEAFRNTLMLRPFKTMFLGFVVFSKSPDFVIDFNNTNISKIDELLAHSDFYIDGYSKCDETGSKNPGKFNSGYYATFTVPARADTVIFNVALSENSGSKRVYDVRDKFVVFEGTINDMQEKDIKFITQLGNYVIKDFETASKVEFLEYLLNGALARTDISESFIKSHVENSCLNITEISVFQQAGVISGYISIEGSFPEAVNEDFQWTIANNYKPAQNVVVAQVLLTKDSGSGGIIVAANSQLSAYIKDGVLYLDANDYNFAKATLSFSYIVCAEEGA